MSQPSDLIGGRQMNWAERRAIVLDRAGYECVECGGTATEADHKWPRVAGGTDDFENLQALCRTCNAAKGDKILIEHMTPARLEDTVVLELVAAIDAANRAVRFRAIRSLMLAGWDARSAHDEVDVDPARFPEQERQWVADFMARMLVPAVGAEPKFEPVQ